LLTKLRNRVAELEAMLCVAKDNLDDREATIIELHGAYEVISALPRQ
jgi:hypothetical protein